jgi:uncharacterized protein (DUF849 family)
MRFLPRIKQATDAVVNITAGGSVHMSLEERLAAPLLAKPEMCSLNMGTMNFGIFPLADRYTSWKHDWEQPYLHGSDDFIFRNTFRDIERILKTLGEEHGTRFEHDPFFVQSIFGILGGIGAEPQNLMFMKETADRLLGNDYRWSVLAAGRFQMPFATHAATMGGNVRVGLEDSLFIGTFLKSSVILSRLQTKLETFLRSREAIESHSEGRQTHLRLCRSDARRQQLNRSRK